MDQRTTTSEHHDVIIVGAGLSGVGAARHLQSRLPEKTFLILEGRQAMGGTWDLFRYPGVRSDSDMYTLGYSFRPWTQAKAIADGPSILDYVRDTAREAGIGHHIRYNHQVRRASWSSEDARWTVEVEQTETGERLCFTCNWLHMCTGYYDYAQGYLPYFEEREAFRGRIVHPQFWPEDLHYKGKRVVVIGSGATAVTIVPEMARETEHVVMLQRSPTYMVSLPSEDGIANALRKLLPSRLAYGMVRWKNVLLQMIFFQLARRRPEKTKANLLKRLQALLPADYDFETHFTPSYNPWDQRLCLVPDADMFNAISEGRASIVTGTIERFTPKGIRLASGEEIEADIIVTATGLKVQLFSDIEFSIDGEARSPSGVLSYKAMMFDGMPNFSYTFGYTNASWTLKADLTALYLCRLLRHMDEKGYAIAAPRAEANVEKLPFLEFTSGYVQRAKDLLPAQGARRPWRVHQNYALDMLALKFGKLEDGVMEFRRVGAPAKVREPA